MMPTYKPKRILIIAGEASGGIEYCQAPIAELRSHHASNAICNPIINRRTALGNPNLVKLISKTKQGGIHNSPQGPPHRGLFISITGGQITDWSI